MQNAPTAANVRKNAPQNAAYCCQHKHLGSKINVATAKQKR
jgi:hypothetical protein